MKTIKALGYNVHYIGPQDDDYYKNPPAESNFFSFIEKYLNTNFVYFDVGANLGFTALPIAKYLNKGFVYAFEPSPIYKYLEEHTKINSINNLKAFNVAIGEKKGLSNFWVRDCAAHSNRVTDAHILSNSLDYISVELTTLDEIVKTENIDKVDFVKVDVEGYERGVVMGASNLIKRFNPIFYIEFNSWTQIAFNNENPRIFLKFLTETFSHIYSYKNREIRYLDSEKKLFDFLHDHIVHHNGFDDVICLNCDLELHKNCRSLVSLISQKISI